jgi:hypothetical protein
VTGVWEIHTDGEGVTATHPNGTKLRLDDAAGTVSDTFHTIDELYRHRALLTAALFGKLYEDESNHGRIVDVHKARLHSDGTGIDGFFVVMATLYPGGQISYHYPEADWDLFDIPERTSADVLDRLERHLRGA